MTIQYSPMTSQSCLPWQERQEAEQVHGGDPAAAKPAAKAVTFDPDESLAAAQEAAGVAAEEQQARPQKAGPTPAQRTAIQVTADLQHGSRTAASARCAFSVSSAAALQQETRSPD